MDEQSRKKRSDKTSADMRLLRVSEVGRPRILEQKPASELSIPGV
jgi:hypothetical protein